jgi:hypothetical protein
MCRGALANLRQASIMKVMITIEGFIFATELGRLQSDW